MMRSMFLLALPALGAAATIHSEQASSHKGLMRKNVVLHASGEIKILASGPAATEMVQTVRGNTDTEPSIKNKDLCDFNFTEGEVGASTCTDTKTQQQIDKPSMCLSAATAAVARHPDKFAIGNPFVIDVPVDYAKYPQGCHYSKKDGKDVWFHNPVGYKPELNNTITGTPVCVETEFINGTDNSNECGNDEYSNILDEEECKTFANCQSDCTHEFFRVLNVTLQKNLPAGCHTDSQGCVLFNNDTSMTSAIRDKDNIHAKPACQINYKAVKIAA